MMKVRFSYSSLLLQVSGSVGTDGCIGTFQELCDELSSAPAGRTFELCSNTNFVPNDTISTMPSQCIVYFDSDITCGPDGLLTNNCTFVGGDSPFIVSSEYGSHSASFRGVTFKDVSSSSGKGSGILFNIHAGNHVNFTDVVFEDNVSDEYLVLIGKGANVAFTRTTFRNNLSTYKGVVRILEYALGLFRESCFIDNISVKGSVIRVDSLDTISFHDKGCNYGNQGHICSGIYLHSDKECLNFLQSAFPSYTPSYTTMPSLSPLHHPTRLPFIPPISQARPTSSPLISSSGPTSFPSMWTSDGQTYQPNDENPNIGGTSTGSNISTALLVSVFGIIIMGICLFVCTLGPLCVTSTVTETDSDKEDLAFANIIDEADETMEALRTLLLQNQSNLTPVGSAIMHSSNDVTLKDHILNKDAGVLDTRLAGCGPLSPLLYSAINMWKEKYYQVKSY